MSYLVLVRHGESFWNKEGYNCFTGWNDVGNLPSGIKKMIKAGKILENFKFDIAFTSELYRGIETTMLILEHNKVSGTPIIIHKKDKIAKWAKFYHKDFGKFVPVIKAWQLNERYYGKLQGMNKDKARKKFGKDIVFKWRRSFEINPPGGESLKDTYKRVIPYFKRKILPELKKGKNVLIGAHGNSLRALVMYLDKIPPEKIPFVEIKKGIPLFYKYEKGKIVKIGYIFSKSKLPK
ncbi:MAG: phosphoglycerate mutase [Candidatus Aenigmarchaeota archaeon ex4484_224]|nr:MAG: phosphoglycerate mutase [Candidatus Aenigmarchaeota archaeon ex4484_224]